MRLWKGKIKMLWAILSTLLVGAVAGWLASKIMGGGGSLVRNIAVGVIGSCVGGLLFGLLGFSAHSLFANKMCIRDRWISGRAGAVRAVCWRRSLTSLRRSRRM